MSNEELTLEIVTFLALEGIVVFFKMGKVEVMDTSHAAIYTKRMRRFFSEREIKCEYFLRNLILLYDTSTSEYFNNATYELREIHNLDITTFGEAVIMEADLLDCIIAEIVEENNHEKQREKEIRSNSPYN